MLYELCYKFFRGLGNLSTTRSCPLGIYEIEISSELLD